MSFTNLHVKNTSHLHSHSVAFVNDHSRNDDKSYSAQNEYSHDEAHYGKVGESTTTGRNFTY